MSPYRVKQFADCAIKMVAEMVHCGRYVEPIIWTRYHLYVVTSPGSTGEGVSNTEEAYCHYGFDSKRTADMVWDELAKRLDESRDKLGVVKGFTIDDLDLANCEGRIIRYLERGRVWAVFPPRIRHK